jgi:hypothetical protein
MGADGHSACWYAIGEIMREMGTNVSSKLPLGIDVKLINR